MKKEKGMKKGKGKKKGKEVEGKGGDAGLYWLLTFTLVCKTCL